LYLINQFIKINSLDNIKVNNNYAIIASLENHNYYNYYPNNNIINLVNNNRHYKQLKVKLIKCYLIELVNFDLE